MMRANTKRYPQNCIALYLSNYSVATFISLQSTKNFRLSIKEFVDLYLITFIEILICVNMQSNYETFLRAFIHL